MSTRIAHVARRVGLGKSAPPWSVQKNAQIEGAREETMGGRCDAEHFRLGEGVACVCALLPVIFHKIA